MRKDQLAQLIKMPKEEVIHKYFPMLLRREITQAQYDFILNQIKSDAPDNNLGSGEGVTGESEDSPSPETRPPAPPEGSDELAEMDLLDAVIALGGQLTQTERLLMLLEDGDWHTTVEIADKVYGSSHLGLSRVGARIYDLKQKGYDIESRRHAKTIWEYRLLPSNDGQGQHSLPIGD